MGALTDLRTVIATALGDACVGTDWQVYPLPVESPQPSCYLLLWSDPWLEGPVTSCFHRARLDVRVIGPRIQPDTGVEVLERMIEAAALPLEHSGHPIRLVSTPEPYVIDGVQYQSAVISLIDSVNIGGSQ